MALVRKPFSDAEIVKDCFLASAEILFTEFERKDAIIKQIKGLQLSDLMEDIGTDVSAQLIEDVSAAPCFSIAVDESTDVVDIVIAIVSLGKVPQGKCFLRRNVVLATPLLHFLMNQNLQVCARMAHQACEARRKGS